MVDKIQHLLLLALFTILFFHAASMSLILGFGFADTLTINVYSICAMFNLIAFLYICYRIAKYRQHLKLAHTRS